MATCSGLANPRIRRNSGFEYDDLDRLTRAYTAQKYDTAFNPHCPGTPSMSDGGLTADTGTGYDRHYSYDAIGNITELDEQYNDPTTVGVDDRFTNTYTYGTGAHGPHAVSTMNSGTWTFDYDAAGNQTDRNTGTGNHTLTYNKLNQTSSYNNGTTTTSYIYNNDGIRLRETIGTSHTVYNNQYWEHDGTNTTIYFYANGERVALDRNGTVQYHFRDHLDSITTSIATTGAKRNRYHPHGTPRDILPITETSRGFTSQRQDDTGLMYYNARYYDPLTTRFTQPDTIIPDPANPQDLNRYTYVRGNPATDNDPSGHCIEANSLSFNEETGYIHYTPMRGPECSGAGSRFPGTGELGGIPGTTAQLGATEDSLAWVHYEPLSDYERLAQGFRLVNVEYPMSRVNVGGSVCPLFGCFGVTFHGSGQVTVEGGPGLAIQTPTLSLTIEDPPEPGVSESTYYFEEAGAGPFEVGQRCEIATGSMDCQPYRGLEVDGPEELRVRFGLGGGLVHIWSWTSGD